MASFALFLWVGQAGAATQSFVGTLDPADATTVFATAITLAATSTLTIQSFGYGGSANAPGGTNAAGTVISPGGFDSYVTVFSGADAATATVIASNDDGECPPGVVVGSACLDPSLTLPALPAGTYTIVVSVYGNLSTAENQGTGTLADGYVGFGDYYDASTQLVRTPDYAFDVSSAALQMATSTTFATSPDPSTPGESVTFTATVSGNSPTGTVDFIDGTTTVASNVMLSATDTAQYTTHALAPGSHSLSAVYSGDALNKGSTSAILLQTVAQRVPEVTLESALNPAIVHQPVLFTAMVSGGAVTGNISFFDGTALLDVVPLDLAGTASIDLRSLTPGAHSITARYSGDASNTRATSPALLEQIDGIGAGSVSMGAQPVPALSRSRLLLLMALVAGGGVLARGRVWAGEQRRRTMP